MEKNSEKCTNQDYRSCAKRNPGICRSIPPPRRDHLTILASALPSPSMAAYFAIHPELLVSRTLKMMQPELHLTTSPLLHTPLLLLLLLVTAFHYSLSSRLKCQEMLFRGAIFGFISDGKLRSLQFLQCPEGLVNLLQYELQIQMENLKSTMVRLFANS